MSLYYLSISIIAILFFVVLALTLKLSFHFLLIIILWTFFLSAIFPGLLSIVPPVYSISILFILALIGGTLLYYRGLILLSLENKAKWPLPTERRGDEKDTIFRDSEVNERKEAYPMDDEVMVNEIIDRAFRAKERGDYIRAIQLFKTVLKKSRDVSIKGVVLSEMLVLFKKQGKYLEGARIIDDFLKEEDSFTPSLMDHFHTLSRYLRKLDELLVKAQCPDIPYDQVSALIRVQAEKILK